MSTMQFERATFLGNALVLLLLLSLTGCSVSEINPRNFNIGSLEIASDNSELVTATTAQINLLKLTGRDDYQLKMYETLGDDIVDLAAKGHVTKLQLWYEMNYQLLLDDQVVHDGSYTFSQVFDNDERNHRANLLAKKRFYAKVRDDGVDNMLEKLKLWAAN